ncbi:MAG: GH3 auxin-responsive promoter family protein [Dehalococcoidales bacterium]|nr:GH3 auxin-responsive promoter family protein [Dehalococcoidales bacterium]
MLKAVELLRQGRTEELWQMCCGFTTLSLDQFMSIQRRLLMEQIQLLSHSVLGKKIMQGVRPDSVEEFRRLVPLTTYASYCPELVEKREDTLPVKPAMWVHSSGRSSEYPFKWVPMSPQFSREMSQVMYGLGILASCSEAGDTAHIPDCPRVVYTVAPRPYMSGAMASMLEQQTPVDFYPTLSEAEGQTFEDRIRLGFKQALSDRIDYFFGLSMVLAQVGDKFSQSSGNVKIGPLLREPKALWNVARGLTRSRLAGRPLLPKDIWNVKGIISSGLDSWVYREKIKTMWGRYPLDIYAGTECGIIATQTWDYDAMTFIPNLNFLEFIPEREHLKWEADHNYQPSTVLLDEVTAGENYEMVITNFHGGAMVRYRIGDMVKITSLRNDKLGIDIPQMVFERRMDAILDFVVVKISEKVLWQAIEATGVAYEDWTAYRIPGEQVMHLLVELKEGHYAREADIAAEIRKRVMDSRKSGGVVEDWRNSIDFNVDVTLLPRGSFASYLAQRQAEGADPAHLKPPHINPSEKMLGSLLGRPVAIPTVKTWTEKVPA